MEFEDFENGYEYLKKMRKEEKCYRTELLAMSEKADPFYAGSKSDKKLAKWFANLYKEHKFPKGVHLRRIHYKLISVETYKVNGKRYQNVTKDWNELGRASRYARYLGLVDPDDFDDRRNPDVTVFYPYDELERRSNQEPEITCNVDEDCGWDIPKIYKNLKSSLDDWEFERFEKSGYSYSDIFQNYHLEIWCEKTSMNDILRSICSEYSINLVEGMGFMSITLIRSAIKRFKKVKKAIIILYISDFDPQGHAMPKQVARQLQFWIIKDKCDSEIKLKQIVLTKEQVIKFNLPRLKIKATNICADNFEDVFGSGAVELDALEGIYPGELKKIIINEIKKYYDINLRRKFWDAGDQATEEADRVSDKIEEMFEDRLDELRTNAENIIEDYEDKLQELRDDYETKIEPVKNDLEYLWNNYRMKVNNAYIDVPERPEPEIEDLTDNYLYDSTRSYLDQMQVYKNYKDGNHDNLGDVSI